MGISFLLVGILVIWGCLNALAGPPKEEGQWVNILHKFIFFQFCRKFWKHFRDPVTNSYENARGAGGRFGLQIHAYRQNAICFLVQSISGQRPSVYRESLQNNSSEPFYQWKVFYHFICWKQHGYSEDWRCLSAGRSGIFLCSEYHSDLRLALHSNKMWRIKAVV